MRSQDSSVGIATRHGLEGLGSIPDRARDFSLLHSVQTGSGAHLTPLSNGYRGLFPRNVKLTTHLQLVTR
jgi:hypothetical protein